MLDAALVAHLGFVHEDQPFVIPTLHARLGDRVYVHGSAASRTLRGLAAGIPACLTVTLLDGIVLARSVFEHSMNYRSVVVLGTATPVDEPEEKLAALEAFTEKLLPGRWEEARQPTRKELKATSVLSHAARRGVGEDPRRRARRTATRRTPTSTSGPGTSRSSSRRSSPSPTRRCAPGFPCRPASGRTAGPGSSPRPALHWAR